VTRVGVCLDLELFILGFRYGFLVVIQSPLQIMTLMFQHSDAEIDIGSVGRIFCCGIEVLQGRLRFSSSGVFNT
jgi:hypothetical protein